MNLNELDNVDAIEIIENASAIARLDKYKKKRFIKDYIGLYLSRVGFYGTITPEGNVSALSITDTVFNSNNDIVLLIEGVVNLKNTPVNNGTGVIQYTGLGRLLVNNSLIYGFSGGSGSGGSSTQYYKTESEWAAITVGDGDRLIPYKGKAGVISDSSGDLIYEVIGKNPAIDLEAITPRQFAEPKVETSFPVGGLVFDRPRFYELTLEENLNISKAASGHASIDQLITTTFIIHPNSYTVSETLPEIDIVGDSFSTSETNFLTLKAYKGNVMFAYNQTSGVITPPVDGTVFLTTDDYQSVFDANPLETKFIFEDGAHTFDKLNELEINRSNVWIEIPSGATINVADDTAAFKQGAEAIEVIKSVYTEFNGVDDATFTYSGVVSQLISKRLKISTVGATDYFQLSTVYGDDSPPVTSGTEIAITGGVQDIGDGMFVEFGSITGHTLNDEYWLCTSGEPVYPFLIGEYGGLQTDYVENVIIYGEGVINCNRQNQEEANFLAADISSGVLAWGRTRFCGVYGITINNADRPVMAYGENTGTYGNYGAVTGGESFDGEYFTVDNVTANNTQRGILIGHPAHRGKMTKWSVNRSAVQTDIGKACIEPNFRSYQWECRDNSLTPVLGSPEGLHLWRGPKKGLLINNEIIDLDSSISGDGILISNPPGWTSSEQIQKQNNTVVLSVTKSFSTTFLEDYSADWSTKIPITIDSSEIDSSATNATIPINKSSILTLIKATGDNSGKDLRASTDLSGVNKVPIDVVTNDTGELVEVFVKLPTVSDSVDTTFYLWYGNDDAELPAKSSMYGGYAAYDDSMIYLNHFEQDVISNSNTNSVVSGFTGNAQPFIKANGDFYFLKEILPQDANTITGFTFLAQINKTVAVSGFEMIFSHRYGANDLLQLNITEDGYIAQIRSSGTSIKETAAVPPNVGSYDAVAFVYDNTNNLLKLIVNGVKYEVAADMVGTIDSLLTVIGKVTSTGTGAGFQGQINMNMDDWTMYNGVVSDEALITYQKIIQDNTILTEGSEI